MVAAKFSLEDEQITFLNRHRELGFADKSSLVRTAIDRFRQKWEDEQLVRSAELYAEFYAEDPDLQQLTEQAMQDWPE